MILFILCGSPGSGKTTVSKQIAKERNAIRYSFDEMGCVQHKDLIPHIVKSLHEGKNVVVDALFTQTVWRRMILEATKDIECERLLIYMNTSLEECIRRNRQRKNPLSDFMVESIYQSIERPTESEGWDKITYI